jgi:hypothetical protein
MHSGNDEQLYREQTGRLTRNMGGVMSPSFKCARCKQTGPTKGRVMVVRNFPRAGWICKTCAEKMTERKA